MGPGLKKRFVRFSAILTEEFVGLFKHESLMFSMNRGKPGNKLRLFKHDKSQEISVYFVGLSSRDVLEHCFHLTNIEK